MQYFFFQEMTNVGHFAMGEVECFRCIRACFVWGAKWCPHVSWPVAIYFQEFVEFPVLPSDILVSIVPIICNIPIRCGQCCAQFWWTAPALRLFRIMTCLLFQNQVFSLVLRPYVLGRPVWPSSWMAVRPSTNSLQHFLTCWILITPYLYTHKDWSWIWGRGGGGKFRPQKTKLIYEICHCRTTPPCIAPNWYLLHPLHFTSTWTVTPYQQMDCLINKPATFCTTLLSERTSQICLTLRLLMSYIYGAPILDVSRSHTTTQHSR